MKNEILLFPLILVAFGLLTGCATILGGRSNTLVIESGTGDSLRVFVDDTFIGTGPGKIKVGSRLIQHGSTLTIKKNGLTVMEDTLLRKPKTVYVVMDALIGGIPLGFDFATGQIHRPAPRKFIVEPESSGE